jgi:hypothetical protein
MVMFHLAYPTHNEKENVHLMLGYFLYGTAIRPKGKESI